MLKKRLNTGPSCSHTSTKDKTVTVVQPFVRRLLKAIVFDGLMLNAIFGIFLLNERGFEGMRLVQGKLYMTGRGPVHRRAMPSTYRWFAGINKKIVLRPLFPTPL